MMSDPQAPRHERSQGAASPSRPRARATRPSAASQQRMGSSARAANPPRAATTRDAGEGTGVHRAVHAQYAKATPPLAAPRAGASRAAQGTPEERGVSRGLAVAIALVVCAIIAIGGFFLLTRCVFAPEEDEAPGVEAGQMVTVVIPEGAGGDMIAGELLKAGVINDEKAFMQAVSSQGADMKLKPGTYQLLTGMSPENVVAQLVAGPNTQEGRLTVPEGLSVAKTAEVVEAALGIPADDFLAQAKAGNYLADYPFLSEARDDSLEGFLWAKTYDFSGKEVSADSVIRAMLDQYAAEVPEIDFASGEQEISATYGYDPTDYEILTLASIINAEAGNPEDYALVSSVFWNRIRQGMALQSDATTAYVTGGEVTADDLQQEGPYNTYLNTGLPPTPICTPDLACIEAALHPEATDYLYFLLIERDGYSNRTFSETYEEHLQAIEQARQEMAERGL